MSLQLSARPWTEAIQHRRRYNYRTRSIEGPSGQSYGTRSLFIVIMKGPSTRCSCLDPDRGTEARQPQAREAAVTEYVA